MRGDASEVAVRLEGVGKVFPGNVRALADVNLEVSEGEFLVVLGLSGSGKSTLLRCINRLLDPTSGRIWIFGDEITAAEGSALRRMRGQVAMIFQQLLETKDDGTIELSKSLKRSPMMSKLFLILQHNKKCPLDDLCKVLRKPKAQMRPKLFEERLAPKCSSNSGA